LIARTPRVTSGAGAAGVGRVLGIWKVYRAARTCLKGLLYPLVKVKEPFESVSCK
jgi:hypothetical protein